MDAALSKVYQSLQTGWKKLVGSLLNQPFLPAILMKSFENFKTLFLLPQVFQVRKVSGHDTNTIFAMKVLKKVCQMLFYKNYFTAPPKYY